MAATPVLSRCVLLRTYLQRETTLCGKVVTAGSTTVDVIGTEYGLYAVQSVCNYSQCVRHVDILRTTTVNPAAT